MDDITSIADKYINASEKELHDMFYNALPIGSMRYANLHHEIRQLALAAKENRKVQL